MHRNEIYTKFYSLELIFLLGVLQLYRVTKKRATLNALQITTCDLAITVRLDGWNWAPTWR